MRCLKNWFFNLSGIAGFICIMLAAGTSDFYTVEINQPEPAGVGKLLFIGLCLLVIGGIHWFNLAIEEIDK